MSILIEAADVNNLRQAIRQTGVPVAIDLRSRPWGDCHFAIGDPNGIGIDVVHCAPSQKK